MTPKERHEAIEHMKLGLADLIPYDTPDYQERLQEMAEQLVDQMLTCEEE